MRTVTPFRETSGRGIAEILRRAEDAKEYDFGAIFRRATNAQSIEASAFVMGLWLFDDEDCAKEALRVLKGLLSKSKATVWIEPAIHSAMNEPDGWVAIYNLDLAERVGRAHREEILVETPT